MKEHNALTESLEKNENMTNCYKGYNAVTSKYFKSNDTVFESFKFLTNKRPQSRKFSKLVSHSQILLGSVGYKQWDKMSAEDFFARVSRIIDPQLDYCNALKFW